MPDLVILDFSMPLKDGLEVVGEVTRLGIPSKILVLTMHNSSELVAAVRQSGAAGYVNNTHAASDTDVATQKNQGTLLKVEMPLPRTHFAEAESSGPPSLQPASGLTRNGPEVRIKGCYWQPLPLEMERVLATG
jgi:chemotaxis response regulator CheB